MININNNRNITLNLTAINKSISARNDVVGSSDKINNKNEKNNLQISVSSVGRSMNSMSRVDLLMNQRYTLLERKEEMISLARESGKDKKTIEQELEAFDKQLQNLDEQIINATTEELEENIKKDNKNNIKTKEEIQTENIFNVIDIGESLKQVEVNLSIKNKIDRERSTLSSQIKTDGSKSSSRKIEKLVELDARSSNLMAEIGKIQGDINNELEETAERTIEETKINYSFNKKNVDGNNFINKENKENKENNKNNKIPITQKDNVIYERVNYTI